MADVLILLRNYLTRFFYKVVFRPIFFRLDPEATHDLMIGAGKLLGSNLLTRSLTGFLFSYSNQFLEQEILGIKFSNPVGLAAGFDKDGVLTDILPSVGFGFLEVGSVTGEMCTGNQRPRLWRLKKSKGLLVYYGLKSEGCEKVSFRLKNKSFSVTVGVNIAKTNSPQTVGLEEGARDYVKAYRAFTEIGSYLTVNISCPNAYGGQPFTSSSRLDYLLGEMDRISIKKPVFLKISPDTSEEEIDQIIEVARKYKISGFICSNLTENRENKRIIEKDISKKGGVSGKPCEDLTNELISYIYQRTKGEFIIIGCGGVFSAKDAYKKIRLGASLVQLFTGMIFEGPQLISEINQGLFQLLQKDGYKSISDAVGADAR